MDYYWQIWHGQLLVGSKDLGQVTIWSVDNTDIPAIGGSLKMTYIAKYDDLWHKILRCEPCTLSLKESVVINGRHVSVFKMSSDTPQFLKLTEEMTEVLHKPRMLTCQFLNPGIRVEVVLVPCCTELQQLGVTDAQIDSQPSLVIIFISSESVDTAVGIPRRMDCQLMTHKWSYRCLNDIKEYGGRVYVQASGLKSFFKDSGLWNLCAKNNVEFRVYNSLSGILSNETVPILSGGWLVLLHHSVLDVRLLGKVLMVLLKDGKNDGQQNKIYIPALTFRKYIQLCINTGLAHVISSEGPWRNLGPDSSVSELLNCLAVIHQCFKHVHRHPTVLVSHCVRTRNQTNFYRLYQLSNFYPKFILGHS